MSGEIGLGGRRRARTCRRPRARGRVRRVAAELTRHGSPFYASPRAGVALWEGPSTTDAAIRRTFSTDSSSPTEMRMPSPANGRTTRPARSKRLGDRQRLVAGRAARRSCPAASGTRQPCVAQARRRAGRAARRSRATRSSSSASASRLASAASSACAVTESGIAGRCGRHRGCAGARSRSRRAARPARTPSRRCAARRGSGTGAAEHAQAVDGVGVGDELGVRLVEDHQHVARDASR